MRDNHEVDLLLRETLDDVLAAHGLCEAVDDVEDLDVLQLAIAAIGRVLNAASDRLEHYVRTADPELAPDDTSFRET